MNRNNSPPPPTTKMPTIPPPPTLTSRKRNFKRPVAKSTTTPTPPGPAPSCPLLRKIVKTECTNDLPEKNSEMSPQLPLFVPNDNVDDCASSSRNANFPKPGNLLPLDCNYQNVPKTVPFNPDLPGPSNIALNVHLPCTYLKKNGYEIMFDDQDRNPHWVRVVLERNKLQENEECKLLRSTSYITEKELPKVLRASVDCFRMRFAIKVDKESDEEIDFDFVVGHMIASVYLGHDVEANSLANCTIENRILNSSIGLAIEREVMRTALVADHVVVMKGKMRKFENISKDLETSETIYHKGVGIIKVYWKAIAAGFRVGSSFKYEIRCWIMENRAPPQGARINDYLKCLKLVRKNTNNPVFQEFFPFTTRYQGKPIKPEVMMRLYDEFD